MIATCTEKSRHSSPKTSGRSQDCSADVKLRNTQCHCAEIEARERTTALPAERWRRIPPPVSAIPMAMSHSSIHDPSSMEPLTQASRRAILCFKFCLTFFQRDQWTPQTRDSAHHPNQRLLCLAQRLDGRLSKGPSPGSTSLLTGRCHPPESARANSDGFGIGTGPSEPAAFEEVRHRFLAQSHSYEPGRGASRRLCDGGLCAERGPPRRRTTAHQAALGSPPRQGQPSVQGALTYTATSAFLLPRAPWSGSGSASAGLQGGEC